MAAVEDNREIRGAKGDAAEERIELMIVEERAAGAQIARDQRLTRSPRVLREDLGAVARVVDEHAVEPVRSAAPQGLQALGNAEVREVAWEPGGESAIGVLLGGS